MTFRLARRLLGGKKPFGLISGVLIFVASGIRITQYGVMVCFNSYDHHLAICSWQYIWKLGKVHVDCKTLKFFTIISSIKISQYPGAGSCSNVSRDYVSPRLWRFCCCGNSLWKCEYAWRSSLPGSFQRMAAEVDELHQRISKKMVCPFERTSILLQVLKMKVVSDVCHCRTVFKMADDHVNFGSFFQVSIFWSKIFLHFRSQAEMAHTCRGTINLAGAFIDSEDSCSFVISNGGTQVFYMRASSEVERQRWVTALELAKAKAIKMLESGLLLLFSFLMKVVWLQYVLYKVHVCKNKIKLKFNVNSRIKKLII